MADYDLANVLAALIQSEMELEDGRVLVYNSILPLPKDPKIMVAVGFVSEKVYGTNRSYSDDPTNPEGLIEEVSTNVSETYAIDIYSQDNSARIRKNEIIFALNSTQAERLAEQYAFRIARIPAAFVDVSQVEGAARLNRYQLTMKVLRAHSRIRTVLPYTNFSSGAKALITND